MDTAEIVLQAAQLVVALAGLIPKLAHYKNQKTLIAGLALETLNDDSQEQDDAGGSDAPRNQSSSTPNDC